MSHCCSTAASPNSPLSHKEKFELIEKFLHYEAVCLPPNCADVGVSTLTNSRGRRSPRMCSRCWKQPCWILPRLILLPGTHRTISDSVRILIVCIWRVSPQKMNSDCDTMTCLSAPSFPSFLTAPLFPELQHSCCRSVCSTPAAFRMYRNTLAPPNVESTPC